MHSNGLFYFVSRAFRVNNQWSQLLTLLEYCPKFLPDLRDEVCIAVANIVNQPGLRERAINLIDKMPEDLVGRLSTEVGVELYTARVLQLYTARVLQLYTAGSCFLVARRKVTGPGI